MKTIFYLIDLTEGVLVSSHEGDDDVPPAAATLKAEDLVSELGHSYVLARGKLFFRKDMTLLDD